MTSNITLTASKSEVGDLILKLETPDNINQFADLEIIYLYKHFKSEYNWNISPEVENIIENYKAFKNSTKDNRAYTSDVEYYIRTNWNALPKKFQDAYISRFKINEELNNYAIEQLDKNKE